MEPQTQANRQPPAPLDPPSPWAWTIGRVFGIPIRIHFTFPLLLVFLGWIEAQQSGGNVLMEIAFVVALFVCVLLHELGHALTARAYRIRTADITLYPIGGVARLESMGKPAQEFWIAIAGPLVNVAIALALAGGLTVFGQSLLPAQGGPGEFAQRVLFANVLLALFNLLPAFPMDGGRILRALLAQRMDYTRATNIASVIGRGFAVIFGIIGLVTFNFLLLIVAFFLYVGATGEAGAQRAQAALEGVKAREAMMTRFETLTHGQSLGDAADALLMGYQQDFPVMLGDRVLGVLSRDQL
ncbi:MAG: site-2 protease family protein, partial [Dehalococcoidia bacterium]|nr:site-2 protease family protein [Dehalococcoidia bacterium]